MSSGKRSSYELTTPAGDEERPHSFYDNITGTGSSSSGTKTIQIPDIQFKFDDDIPVTADPRLSTVMTNARSDFFGLSSPDQDDPDSKSQPTNIDDETQRLMPMTDQDRTTPPAVTIVSSISSPSSGAGDSTAPVRPSSSSGGSGSPGPPRCESPGGGSSRPVSSQRNITIRLPDSDTPSEAVYMTTTVPQNFSKNSNNLIGRHKPTRSSLRHSRMLVVNKNYHQRYPKGNSLNLKHIRLSRVLMALMVLIGSILTFVGMTTIVWSPNTHTKDNPYWAGMILTLCGSLFLLLFNFKRRPANRLRENLFNFIRVNALVILLLTIFFTMLAFIYALIHTTNLSSSHLRCEPEYHFNVNSSSCVCLIDTRGASRGGEGILAASELRSGERVNEGEGYGDEGEARNSTSSTYVPVISGIDLRKAAEQLEDEGVIRLEYRDFNCSEVLSVWFYVSLTFAVLSIIGCLLASSFLVIYAVECQRRIHQLKYYSVRTTNGNAGSSTTAAASSSDGEDLNLEQQETGNGNGTTPAMSADTVDKKDSGSADVKTSEA